jgi:hypothetical protein
MSTNDDLARSLLAADLPDGHSIKVIGEPTYDELGIATEVVEGACGTAPDVLVTRKDTFRVCFEREDEEPVVAGIPVLLSDLIPRGVAFLAVREMVEGGSPCGMFRLEVVG